MGRKYTEAQKASVKRYNEKNDCIRFYAPKGFKQKALKKAGAKGFDKLGPYIIDLIKKDS